MTTLAPNPVTAGYEFDDAMPIAGEWRAGSGGNEIPDRSPWSGDTLLSLSPATREDVDSAYAAAIAAQRDWARTLPAERANLLRAAAEVMTARQEEIVEWLVHESGGTVAKSTIEWDVTRSAFLNAAHYPYQMGGQILPSDVPGKQYQVHRRPVGVVTIISPWNFPLYLTNRSLA